MLCNVLRAVLDKTVHVVTTHSPYSFVTHILVYFETRKNISVFYYM